MSVVQCDSCLKIFIGQLCGNIIYLYCNCDYTQPVGNRSQTPISSYKMYNPRVGVRFQHTPYVCILKSRWRHRSRSAQSWQITFARRDLSQQPTGERKRIVPTCVQVCVTRCDVRLQISTYCQTVTGHLSLRIPPPSLWVDTMWRATTYLHAVTTVTKHLSLRNPSRSQLLTFDIHIYICISI